MKNTNSLLVEKINKLLALSSSSNPHEAALALKRAQKLMALYKISNQDLDICKIENLNLSLPYGYHNKKVALLLGTIICKILGLLMITKSKSPQSITSLHFFGYEEKILQIDYIFTYLIRSLNIAKERYRHKLSYEYLEEKKQNKFIINLKEKIFNIPKIKQSENLVNNLQKEQKRKISQEKNKVLCAYLEGYLIAILKEIDKPDLNESDIDLINKAIHDYYGVLTTVKSRSRKLDSRAYNAYKSGLIDGEKNKIKAPLANRSQGLNLIK